LPVLVSESVNPDILRRLRQCGERAFGDTAKGGLVSDLFLEEKLAYLSPGGNRLFIAIFTNSGHHIGARAIFFVHQQERSLDQKKLRAFRAPM
jgi:hypothetical protein